MTPTEYSKDQMIERLRTELEIVSGYDQVEYILSGDAHDRAKHLYALLEEHIQDLVDLHQSELDAGEGI